MNTSTHQRPQTSTPSDGSRTITLRDAQPRSEDDDDDVAAVPSAEPIGVLRLRGAQRRTRQRVVWGADVVDNEGHGKKKSKICCIYHKPRPFDESSSESASDSDPDSSEGRRYGDDRARAAGRCRRASRGHKTIRREGKGGTIHEPCQSDSDSDVNAYERAPKRKG